MALNLTEADKALKEFYLPPIREQLNNANVLSAIIEKKTEDVEGRRAVLSLHLGRNSGVGARGENGALPTAGSQVYAEERVPIRYNYGRIQVSGPVIAAMKSDKGSFTRAIESESKRVVDDLKREVNRQRWGTSNGVIATTGTTSTSTTVVLAATTTLTQLRQLEVGSVVDIGTVASPTSVATARKITAVDRANKTVTIDGAAVSTNGTQFLFRSGAGGATTAQKELTGLQTIVSDSGELFNVDPATYPIWKSYVDSNSGTLRAPSDSLFEEAMDEISIESGVDPDIIITTAGVNRAYAASLKSQKRYANTQELKGGFKALTVETGRASIALTWDRDCPSNQAYVLTSAHLTEHRQADWSWMDQDGAVLSRVANTDAYEGTMYCYHEQTTDRRAAHGVIKDLAE